MNLHMKYNKNKIVRWGPESSLHNLVFLRSSEEVSLTPHTDGPHEFFRILLGSGSPER